MISNFGYNGILVGFYIITAVIIIVILTIVGTKVSCFSFLEANFDISQASKNDNEFILNVYGSQVKFVKHKRVRITFNILVLPCFYVINISYIY